MWSYSFLVFEFSSRRTEKLQEIYRLMILILCVLLTVTYLGFLFLFIRQLYHEGGGNVFGHAVTRNIAFYVQPQFAASQGTQDNKDQAVQRSQTQIPQDFLPQGSQQTQQLQIQSSPKKMNQVQQQPTTQTQLAGGGGGSNVDVQRSPKRQPLVRPPSEQSPSLQNYSPKRNPIPQVRQQQHQQLPILGPSGHQGVLAQPPSLPPTPIMRGPIPAQVRIGFYPQDLRQGQGQGDYPSPQLQVRPMSLSPRPRIPFIPEEGEIIGPGPPLLPPHHHQRIIRGPPPGAPYPPPPHQYLQPPPPRVQFQYPSDSSPSTVAYSPNVAFKGGGGGRHPISMV